MTDIKIIEGLEKHEVMARAFNGEPVAYRISGVDQDIWDECTDPLWNWGIVKYAIIDTSVPEMSWDFDWDFFNQYGGLKVDCGLVFTCRSKEEAECENVDALCESPFYYWGGGKQPVPDGVEVEIVFRNHTDKNDCVDTASTWDWSRDDNDADIIAFKLTGN